MTERRDPNNVPMNDDFLNNLPDRKIAERNSVYNADDIDTKNLENLPDRKIAERNSVYKLANKKRDADGLEIDENETGNQQDFRDSTFNNSNNINPANSASNTRQSSERGSQVPAGSSYPVNRGGTDKNTDVITEHAGPGFSVRHGNNAGDQLGYDQQVEQGWGDKENQLQETVSLNEQGYNGPSKLDNLDPDPNTTRRNQVGFKGSMVDADREQGYTTQSHANPTFGTDSQIVSDVNDDPGYRPS